MTLELIPRDNSVSPLIVKASQFQEYFGFMRNYLIEGMVLLSHSSTQITINSGKARINGLVASITTDETVTVTGTGKRYVFLHLTRSTDNEPTGFEILFEDGITMNTNSDYMLLGAVEFQSSENVFNVEMLARNTYEISSDGYIYGSGTTSRTFSSDTTVDSELMMFRDVVVEDNVRIRPNGKNLIWLINGTLELHGIIDVSGVENRIRTVLISNNEISSRDIDSSSLNDPIRARTILPFVGAKGNYNDGHNRHGDGGNGGGFVQIVARNIVTGGSGEITADGADGGDGNPTQGGLAAGDGGDGGEGGGAIVMYSELSGQLNVHAGAGLGGTAGENTSGIPTASGVDGGIGMDGVVKALKIGL